MGGSAKRARGEGGGAAGSSGSSSLGDRLSALPDCLLHTIMSFMKARQVVQTSVLSKRWTHLWRSVPCLDIDDHEGGFPAAADEDGDHDHDHDHDRKFANFVDNLLLFHDAPTLDAFRLRFGDGYSNQNRDADRWIRRAIKYAPTVLEVHLHFGHFGYVRLPGLGTCSHRLKRLHLSSVSLDVGFARQIQFGCPVLEDLELTSCYCTFREITSHTCKIFKMDNIYVGDGRVHDIVIIMPVLESLQLVEVTDLYPNDFSVKEATNLVQASIHFCSYRHSSLEKHLPKLLAGLSSVRNLKVTTLKTMVPVDEMPEKFPAFSNLRTLILDRCQLGDNFKMLGQFLRSAPNLEKLTLQDCTLSEGMSRKKVKSMRKTLKCQNLLTFECSNLKLIEIKSSEGNVQQLFNLLFSIWENLHKITVVLTKE